MAYTAYSPISFVSYDKSKPPEQNPANAFWQSAMITGIESGIQGIESALVAADLNTVSEAGGLVAWGASLGGGGDFLTKAVADTLYPAIADFDALGATVSGKADTSALADYLTATDAASTYATQTALTDGLATKADSAALADYLTEADAASTYATTQAVESVEQVAMAGSATAADAMSLAQDNKIVSGEYTYDATTFEPKTLTLAFAGEDVAPVTITLTPEA